ncbi:hypothetical protein Acy02nite_48780 [Actinoplanes cyaneus]|uniref:Uncharacterized protein n=1 Tax=Actinoplanes cyaneus TaxID=52696 RepID=A0A919M5T3_9ACTN|nr:hypothetical protein [Actinoplanes cyaneus]GID66997.1 hypothetical protein Acy02nite_48780 [Actinoplanes cyaneus]
MKDARAGRRAQPQDAGETRGAGAAVGRRGEAVGAGSPVGFPREADGVVATAGAGETVPAVGAGRAGTGETVPAVGTGEAGPGGTGETVPAVGTGELAGAGVVSSAKAAAADRPPIATTATAPAATAKARVDLRISNSSMLSVGALSPGRTPEPRKGWRQRCDPRHT